jgi:hypothetical protein
VSGTGSYPVFLLNGLHLNNLFKAIKEPFKTPNLLTAIYAYSEQVGVNLQAEGRYGEIAFL